MAYCSKCGAELPAEAGFCAKCGAAQSTGAVAQTASSAQSGMSENVAALLCYLVGWITGIIFFLIDKRPFVRFHAAQSIVVFGGLHIIHMVLGMFFGVGFWLGGFAAAGMGAALMGLVGLVGFILWILLMIKGYQHEKFEVPIAAGIAKSFAGN